MILEALYRYAEEQLDQPPEMYVNKNVRYVVELDSSGRCLGITEPLTPVEDPDGAQSGGSPRQRTPRRGITLAVPRLAVNRSGTRPKPLLLADNGEYALCVGREGANDSRVAERHAAFVELLSECYGRTASEDVGSVLAWLDRLGGGNGDPAGASSATPDIAYANLRRWDVLPEEYDPTGTVTFRVEDRFPVEDEAVRRFWGHFTEDESLPYGRCYVTGEISRLVQRMPGGVRGVPGGQASGAKLVAVNRDAFESYGLANALNCPVSRNAAIKIDATLNSLVADRDRTVTVGETLYTFFTLGSSGRPSVGGSAPVDSGAFVRDLLAGPTDEAVATLLSWVYSGKDQATIEADISSLAGEEDNLYCLALSANSSRLIVKDYVKAPVEEILAALQRWFVAQRIVTYDGDELSTGRSVYGLIASTLPSQEDLSSRLEKIPSEADDYVRAALLGGPLPERVLGGVCRRNRKEGRVGTQQAQLLKLALSLKGVIGVQDLQDLTDEPDLAGANRDAYYLGRLLACLESIQLSAQGRVNRSIVDRYYAMASVSPARGFAVPQSLAYRAHLPKLRRNKPGVYMMLNTQLQQIHGELPVPLPSSLSVERQSLFSIGYYHQSTNNRNRALAKIRSSQAKTS